MPTGDPICSKCGNYTNVCTCSLQQIMSTPEDFMTVTTPVSNGKFIIVHKSLFDVNTKAIVNTVNCVGVMGAGIALEFKKRFPLMFSLYKGLCDSNQLNPGDCYTYFDDNKKIYVLNLAVKNNWKNWSTLEWLEHSLKSLKLAVLENDIKSVALPLIGGKNGRRGPFGRVPNMTPPPEGEELKQLIQSRLEPFANKFGIEIQLCIPLDCPKKVEHNLEEFFNTI